MRRLLSSVATRARQAHRPLSGRGGIRLAATVLAAGLLGGCIPLMLGGLLLGGGEWSASGGSGPFSGAPHSVQNAEPSTPGSEALSSVVDRPILDSCKEKLPDPPEALPSTGCSIRASCLGGMSTPMQLRVCAIPQKTPGATPVPDAAAPEEG